MAAGARARRSTVVSSSHRAHTPTRARRKRQQLSQATTATNCCLHWRKRRPVRACVVAAGGTRMKSEGKQRAQNTRLAMRGAWLRRECPEAPVQLCALRRQPTSTFQYAVRGGTVVDTRAIEAGRWQPLEHSLALTMKLAAGQSLAL